MGRRTSRRGAVRLDDGTNWHVDAPEGDALSLEWILRYGSEARVLEHRLAIAEVLGSFSALLRRPQRERNAIVSEILRALAAPSPSNPTEPK